MDIEQAMRRLTKSLLSSPYKDMKARDHRRNRAERQRVKALFRSDNLEAL